MDTDLICRWLNLPPGSWPPDHYTLLGFNRGEGDALRAELVVQERMQYLRQFQLTHPELATEAMNRLAQALLCLSNAQEKAAYDQQLIASAEAPPPHKEAPTIQPVKPIVARQIPVARLPEPAPVVPAQAPTQGGIKPDPVLRALGTRDLLCRISQVRNGARDLASNREHRRALLDEVRVRRRRRRWLRPMRFLGRFYLAHAGTFLTGISWLALDLASSRFREQWRLQLSLFFILAVTKISLFTRGGRP